MKLSAVKLSDDQRRAVERCGQECVRGGGAGVGQDARVDGTLRLAGGRSTHRSRPHLAVTFTEKAATEIKERLVDRFTDRPELREAIERAWVSTIHGFCARLLREHAIAAGLAPDFRCSNRLRRKGWRAKRPSRPSMNCCKSGRRRRAGCSRRSDLSTQDDGRQPDLARSLLEVYEAQRLSGGHDRAGERDRAACVAKEDAIEEACELARAILKDRLPAGLGQRAAHAELREWARAFLDNASEQRPELARLTVNLGSLMKNSAARNAAWRLKNEVLERVEAEWLSITTAPLRELMRDMIARLDERYRERKRAQAALDFADLEEDAIRLLESDAAIRRATAERFDEDPDGRIAGHQPPAMAPARTWSGADCSRWAT